MAYWPDTIDASLEYGLITVSVREQIDTLHYTITTFRISHANVSNY